MNSEVNTLNALAIDEHGAQAELYQLNVSYNIRVT
jgi:hypothetical protein